MIEKNRTYYVVAQNKICWGEVKFEWYSLRTESFISAICGWLQPSKEFQALDLNLEENRYNVVLVDKVSESSTSTGEYYFSETEKGVIIGHVPENI